MLPVGFSYVDPVYLMNKSGYFQVLNDGTFKVDIKSSWMSEPHDGQHSYSVTRTFTCRIVKARKEVWSGVYVNVYMVPYCFYIEDTIPVFDFYEGHTLKYISNVYVIFPGIVAAYSGEKERSFGTQVWCRGKDEYIPYACRGNELCESAGSFLLVSSIKPVPSASIFGVPLYITLGGRHDAICCPENRNYAEVWIDPREYDYIARGECPDEHWSNIDCGRQWGYPYCKRFPVWAWDDECICDTFFRPGHISVYLFRIVWGYRRGYPPVIPDDSGDFVDHCSSEGDYYSSSHSYKLTTAVFTGCGVNRTENGTVFTQYSKLIKYVDHYITAEPSYNAPVCGNGILEGSEYNKSSVFFCCVDAMRYENYRDICMPYCCVNDTLVEDYGRCAPCSEYGGMCPPAYHIEGDRCVPDSEEVECIKRSDCVNKYGGDVSDWNCTYGICYCVHKDVGGCCLPSDCPTSMVLPSGEVVYFSRTFCLNHKCYYTCPFECCPSGAHYNQHYFFANTLKCSSEECKWTDNGYVCTTGGSTPEECPYECCPPGYGYEVLECEEGKVCVQVGDVFKCVGEDYDDVCYTDDDCVENAICVNGRCKCKPCYVYSDGKCVEITCPEGTRCDPETNSCVRDTYEGTCNDPFGFCIGIGDNQYPATYVFGVLAVLYLMFRSGNSYIRYRR